MNINRNAFTMIELIFVIVVLGILASVAIPRLAATRDDAHIAAGRADLATIRSGLISERQARMFRGDSTYTASLGGNDPLFGTVTQSPVRVSSASGGWTKTDEFTYHFHLSSVELDFDYNRTNGTFTCDPTAGNAAENALCLNLTR